MYLQSPRVWKLDCSKAFQIVICENRIIRAITLSSCIQRLGCNPWRDILISSVSAVYKTQQSAPIEGAILNRPDVTLEQLLDHLSTLFFLCGNEL